MRPTGTRVWRKSQRASLKGIPRGRRATHPVQTTFGAGQKRAQWYAQWSAAHAAFQAEMCWCDHPRKGHSRGSHSLLLMCQDCPCESFALHREDAEVPA